MSCKMHLGIDELSFDILCWPKHVHPTSMYMYVVKGSIGYIYVQAAKHNWMSCQCSIWQNMVLGCYLNKWRGGCHSRN